MMIFRPIKVNKKSVLILAIFLASNIFISNCGTILTPGQQAVIPVTSFGDNAEHCVGDDCNPMNRPDGETSQAICQDNGLGNYDPESGECDNEDLFVRNGGLDPEDSIDFCDMNPDALECDPENKKKNYFGLFVNALYSLVGTVVAVNEQYDLNALNIIDSDGLRSFTAKNIPFAHRFGGGSIDFPKGVIIKDERKFQSLDQSSLKEEHMIIPNTKHGIYRRKMILKSNSPLIIYASAVPNATKKDFGKSMHIELCSSYTYYLGEIKINQNGNNEKVKATVPIQFQNNYFLSATTITKNELDQRCDTAINATYIAIKNTNKDNMYYTYQTNPLLEAFQEQYANSVAAIYAREGKRKRGVMQIKYEIELKKQLDTNNENTEDLIDKLSFNVDDIQVPFLKRRKNSALAGFGIETAFKVPETDSDQAINPTHSFIDDYKARINKFFHVYKVADASDSFESFLAAGILENATDTTDRKFCNGSIYKDGDC